ncbi:MAG TPA: FoF1 ATP synthase subunit a [Candidatus Limnocylindrales bacterium]|nr:FoF1 ATP synthase subunit a [Candidatus Limnocylindrales bacterium]
MTSESSPADAVVPATDVAQTPAKPDRRPLWIAAAGVVVIDALAAIFAAPEGFPAPTSTILQNLEPVPPHVVFDFLPGSAVPNTPLVLDFHPSITSSIVASWIVIVGLLIFATLATRHLSLVPGRLQNLFEAVYDGMADFAWGLGGEEARRYVALFSAFFLFILFANWCDLLLFGDKIEAIRTPTSDINITIGMALVVFALTHVEGVRRLGLAGYLGKFFNFSGFRRGLADGFIDLYVGLIEFLLEFFKPVTLSFRLWGNLYGGGIMLGVFTALVIAFIPIPFIALEGFIGFIQALIFASLTLMYILTAVESHHDEAHAAPAFADEPEGDVGPPLASIEATRAEAR